jgi:hypothetical protein
VVRVTPANAPKKKRRGPSAHLRSDAKRDDDDDQGGHRKVRITSIHSD